MARKSKEEMEKTDGILVQAIVKALRVKELTSDALHGKIPTGLWSEVYAAIPEDVRSSWQRSSLPTTWKQRKERLIPLITPLMTPDEILPSEVSEDITSVETQPPKPVTEDISGRTAPTAELVSEDVSSSDAQTEDTACIDTEPVREDISAPDDVTARETAPLHITEELTAEIERIARRVFENMMHKPELLRMVRPEVSDGDIPPEPKELPSGEKGGRPGTTRKSKRVTITVDSALWAAFEAERKRMGVGSGRMADIVFWRGLDKPLLSFELKKPEDTES
jgi:hypothetical protein